jgi:hypothetical protein
MTTLTDTTIPSFTVAVGHGIPQHHLTLVERLRATVRDPQFVARHRVRPQDFTRQCRLTFPVLLLCILQKSVKSIQRHLNEFLAKLAPGGFFFEPVTPGAVTHARAKFQDSAFVKLNQDCLLPVFYEAEPYVQRWHGHRLVGIDSSLCRLPNRSELGAVFGWNQVTHQTGDTGTCYPEGRISVRYDLLNRIGLDARLEPSRLGEVALAREQLAHVPPGDGVITDCGFTGYLYLAAVRQHDAHFIARCSTGSFLAAQELFRLNRDHPSRVVWLSAPKDTRAECRRLGLPLKMKVRFVSVRLPTGEWEVLATSLLEAVAYPTEEFLSVYHERWDHETYHGMLKGRLDLENFSGQTVAAVRQDFQAAVFLCNLESVLSPPAQAQLDERHSSEVQPQQVNRAVGYHTLKDRVLDWLYWDTPVPLVLAQLQRLFVGNPVTVRPERPAPPRRKKRSYHRSYHYQRRIKKVVY